MTSTSPPGMAPCACPCELGSAQVLGAALHAFMAGIPGALAAAAAAGYSASKAALWSALVAAAGALAAAAAAVARPVAAGAGHLGALLWSHALLVLGSLAAFTAWQIYYPSRFLVRAAGRMSRLRGVTLELPPAPDAPPGAPKYVALTIDDGPCPYHTTAALDALKEAGARATFFITGYHVEECDFQGVGCTLSGGEGLYLIGSEALKRMAMEGHELANLGWSATPTSEVLLKQLAKELADTHKLLATARHTAMMDLTDGSDANALAANAAVAALAHSRTTKWFRPVLSQDSWFTPALVEAVQKLGYSMVLGSVWPWDSFVRSPLLNALYIVTKAYSGAIIVLHDRSAALVPTLQYALPWLRWLGYDVVTLSEAAHRSNGGTPELTPAALDLHNLVHDPPSSVVGSSVAGKSTDSSNGQHIVASSAYLARMAKERERAATQTAVEEAEKHRIKAAKRAEADRRAGINRELANMSAADKRGIERREREKKEAEIRRIKRKEEEVRERERYETYMKERAIKAARDEAARVEARRKAEEDAERKRAAEEEFRQRKEAERRVAAEMVLRQRAEAALAKAGITGVLVAGTASALAAGSSDGGATGASENGDSAGDGSSVSGEQQQGKVKKGLGLLRRLGSKTALKLMGSSKTLNAAEAGTDDGEEAAQPAMEPQPAAQVPEESYAWYGQQPEPAAEATLARIKAAVAAHAAGARALPPPITGSYALGPCNRVLLGFDGRPLLVAQTGKGVSSATVLLDSAGERLRGPQGETIVMLLDANSMPLVDPHGRPVFVAEEPVTGRLLGVHPDGTIIRVPPYTPTPPASISDASRGSPESGSRSSRHRRSSSHSGSHQRSSSGHRGSSSRHHTSSSSGHRRSGSHGASHNRPAADLREQHHQQAQAAADAAVLAAAAASSSGQSEITPLPNSSSSSSPAKGSSTPDAAPAAAHKAAVDKSKWVPAQLLTGPSGKPLLGLDNRPLIVAVDAQGVPLVEGPNSETLLGPFGAPIKLGVCSDGSLVALDNLCRPLQGADCAPRVVALNKRGRPLVDEEGRAITLSVGPTGVVIPDTPPTPTAAPPTRTSGAAALPRVPGAAAPLSKPVAPPPTPAAPREPPFSFSKPAAVTSAAGAGLAIGGRQGAAPFAAAAPAALQVPAAADGIEVARELSFGGASTPDGSDAVPAAAGSDSSPQSAGRTYALNGSTEPPFVFEKVQLGHQGLQLTATAATH